MGHQLEVSSPTTSLLVGDGFTASAKCFSQTMNMSLSIHPDSLLVMRLPADDLSGNSVSYGRQFHNSSPELLNYKRFGDNAGR